MRSTGVHHIDLVVSSIERSLPFYRDLLGPLGWHGVSEVKGERDETIWYLWGTGTSIGLREAQTPSEQPYDRYGVGLHHLALEAASRAVVNERAEWLRARMPRSRAARRSTGTSLATTPCSSTIPTASSWRSCTSPALRPR